MLSSTGSGFPSQSKIPQQGRNQGVWEIRRRRSHPGWGEKKLYERKVTQPVFSRWLNSSPLWLSFVLGSAVTDWAITDHWLALFWHWLCLLSVGERGGYVLEMAWKSIWWDCGSPFEVQLCSSLFCVFVFKVSIRLETWVIHWKSVCHYRQKWYWTKWRI